MKRYSNIYYLTKVNKCVEYRKRFVVKMLEGWDTLWHYRWNGASPFYRSSIKIEIKIRKCNSHCGSLSLAFSLYLDKSDISLVLIFILM